MNNWLMGIAWVLLTMPVGWITAQTPEAFSCPVTPASAVHPSADISPFPPGTAVYHQDGLWVSLPPHGLLELPPSTTIVMAPLSGWRSSSHQWLRDNGVIGPIEVSGRRLDEPSNLTPRNPLSPERQYVFVGPSVTGVAFPSAGCWEVTGTVSDHTITWVVDVRFTEQKEATPAALTS